MRKIGITTTIPVEILYSAEIVPIDCNNIFVMDDDHERYIERAEKDGFPKNLCAWIKGVYGVCMEQGIREIIGVTEGDCSTSKVLLEILEHNGVTIHPFSFPYSQNKEEIEHSLQQLMQLMKVEVTQVEKKRNELNQIRSLVHEMDRLTYEKDLVTGFENHVYQVSCSDFNGNPMNFLKELQSVVTNIKKREPNPKILRLGYVGVPPLTSDLYEFVETLDGRIRYNEVQREFTFPRARQAMSMAEQYLDYTYPYRNEFRIREIKAQIAQRKLDGIIHYTQAFCHRALDHILLKKELSIPILNIEGDQKNVLDARTKLRIEAFMDMLLDLKMKNWRDGNKGLSE